ncbi:MAG: hypothetical protein LBG22_11020 [Treponema sp.]|nr:hypothetical protein [Treponema sp.]
MNESYYGCSAGADKTLESFIAGLPMEPSHHRVESRETRCGFGHVIENTALNLKHTAEIKGRIRGKNAPENLCTIFGLSGGDGHEKALHIEEVFRQGAAV